MGTSDSPTHLQQDTATSPLKAFVDSNRFRNFVLLVIVLNSITMGLETSKSIKADYGGILHLFDNTCLAIYVVEIVLKLIVYRFRFFLDGWNVFDFIIVGIAVAPAMGPLSVLRTLRTLRALRGMRVISAVPEMRRVVVGLLSAIPGMLSIMSLLGLIYYIAAILATTLFGEKFPEWFGTLGCSLYTLFQVMTLESWSMGIVRPVMVEFPHAWVFFVPFILVCTFSVMNLFVAVIVTAVQSADASAGKDDESDGAVSDAPPPAPEPTLRDLNAQIQQLQGQIAELKGLLQRGSTPAASGTK